MTYDVVVTLPWLSVLGTNRAADKGAAAVSDVQSPENWRNRLVQSNARAIFAFGAPQGEIGGDYLGELPGYLKIAMMTRAPEARWSLPYTVYVKNGA